MVYTVDFLGDAQLKCRNISLDGVRIRAQEYVGLQAVTDVNNETSNTIAISNVTQSTSQTTGAFTVSGGVGIAKDLHASKIVANTPSSDSNGSQLNVGNLQGSYLALGAHTEYSWMQSRNSKPLSLNAVGTNVGIGITNPSMALHVAGSIKGTGADDGLLFLENTNSPAILRALTTGGQTYIQSGTASTSDSRADINFTSMFNGTNYMKIQGSTGNVGIGTMSPSTKLVVYGDGQTGNDGIIHAILQDPGATPYEANVFTMRMGGYKHHLRMDLNTLIFNASGNVGRYGTMKFEVGDGTASGNGQVTALQINPGGNVGIGTTNPEASLHVQGARSIFGNNAGASDIVINDIPQARWQIGTGGYALRFSNHNSGSDEYSTWSEKVRIQQNGYVGIGVTPSYPLHVTGSAGNMPSMKYFNSGSTSLASGANDAITIYAAGNIYASGLVAASDERIKKDIVDANDAECLEILRLLNPKKYQYKDEINRGAEPVWGFIAQEVRGTLPYATQLRQDVLPNIYELANVSASNVITFTNFNTTDLESNATTLIRTKGIDGRDHDVHLVEVIDEHTIRVEEDLSAWTGSVDETGNVITEITTTTLSPEEYETLEDKSGYVTNITGYQNANVVVSIEEYNALEDTTGYEEIVQDYIKTTTTYPGTQLFVYGQEVDDFVYLKKEAIWTVATSALQEVDRQLQAEKEKVATLESQLTSVLARLDALESV
jgi:hypothetical protein